MSKSSPVTPGEPHRALLTPSHLALTPDDSGDRMQRTVAWRGSNVSVASPVDSPLVRRAAVNLLLGVPGDPSANDSISSWSLDDQTTTDDSSRTTPLRTHSPDPSSARLHGSKRYRNELWSAIKSDYLYLMDEEIIDACKSTESEISSDEMSSESKVSYNEFLQQYKELTEWLGHIRLMVRQQAASRSENYLTHMYHEEMLKQSPRQQLFNDYARQLMRRYPQLKQEIVSRLSHVNEQWTEVMNGLVLPPGVGCHDTSTMLIDIREDVRALREWVCEMERSLGSLHILTSWSTDKLRQKLTEHQAVQKDIESRSRIVSAVLKLCDWLKVVRSAGDNDIMTEAESAMEDERAAVQEEAEGVEQRSHGVWIQSVEWQLRLEDAINGTNRRLKSLSYSDDDKVEVMRMSIPPGRSAASPECRGNMSAVGVSPEPSEGFDVIPFHDSEYEEIGENDLMFSYVVDSDDDENSGKSNVEKNTEPLSSGSMEAGLDSALGRSVSNPSLHVDSRCPVPTLPVTSTEPNAQLSHTTGVFDFGYSSDGHSNEEPENVMAGKRGLGNLTAVDNRLDETSWDTPVPDSAGTSGIGTNTAQRSGLYHMMDASVNKSDASSLVEPHPHTSLHREQVGEETDDDFSRLNELPLDGAPSASELDLLAKLVSLSDSNRRSLVRAHGRSLDSLAPLGSDKLFSAEKRVSSVEIIVDSVASSSRPSISSQMSRESAAEGNKMMNNIFLWQTSSDGHNFSAPSSCDASSEGTLSDSEISDLGNSDFTGSPSKSRPRTKRVRRTVRSGTSEWCGSTLIKSPTKRRMDSLSESTTAAVHMTRSASHEALEPSRQQDCSRKKRSKICRSMSDLQDGPSPKKATAGRGCRSNLILRKKVPLNRSAYKLNFAEDISDNEAAGLAAVAVESPPKSQYCDNYISWHSTDVDDAVVPEIDDSLTSVTTYNAEIMDVFDDSSWDKGDSNVDIAGAAEWCNSSTFADDFSMNHLQPQTNAASVVQRRASWSAVRASKPSWPDSDSDTEDFLNIVSESHKAFVFTESTLEQFRRDHVEGTVIHDPAEYMGALATCQTNVTCLLELVDALQSGTNVNGADRKIQQITDIVSRWRILEAQTSSLQQDCQQLYLLHLDCVHTEHELELLKRSISFDKFDDIRAVEIALRTTQAGSGELSTSISEQLTSLKQRVYRYHNDNQDVNITRLTATISALRQTAHDLAERCHAVESRLKEAVMTWYQLNEMQQNTEQMIAQEQHQLNCLDVATDIVSLSAADVDDTIDDLKVMTAGWSGHEDKLHHIESLCHELDDICSNEAQSALHGAMHAASEDLHCLQRKCRQIIENLNSHRQSLSTNSREQASAAEVDDKSRKSMDEIDAVDATLFELQPMLDDDERGEGLILPLDLLEDEAVENESKVDDVAPASQPDQLMKMLADDAGEPVMKVKPSAVKVKTGASSSLLRRLLKYSLPLPLLLIILFGSLYLLCDSWHDALSDLGLIVSPQLKYVRGMPPV